MAMYKESYTYEVIKEFKEVRHYQLKKPLIENDLLSPLINVSKNRNYNHSQNARYVLRLRKGNKWEKFTTGLNITKHNLIYYGDLAKKINGRFIKQHLLIFEFSKGGNEITIHLFRNYYPITNKELNIILQQFYNKKQGAII